MSQSRHWCFTLNNYNEQHLNSLETLAQQQAVTYLVYGREVGASGTPHLQGYIVLAVRKRRAQVKSILPGHPHVERAKGSPQQNRTYCIKDQDFVESGTCPGGQGSRTDLLAIKDAIDAGAGLTEVASEYFTQYIRYTKGINEFYFRTQAPRKWKTKVIVYYGATGTGKTRRIHEAHESLYVHAGGKYFDGYEGDAIALFDDYGGSEFKLSYLLKLLDRYEMKVEIKGSMRQWKPKKIYITSNKEPNMWYPNAYEEHRLALLRRLTKIVLFKQDGTTQTIKDEL